MKLEGFLFCVCFWGVFWVEWGKSFAILSVVDGDEDKEIKNEHNLALFWLLRTQNPKIAVVGWKININLSLRDNFEANIKENHLKANCFHI